MDTNKGQGQSLWEERREIPILKRTEVLVVGSGPSGLAAALAAARTGAQTLLVERYGCLGGNITQAGVESFAWYRHEGTVESAGIGWEMEERAVRDGIARKEPQSDSHVIDPEGFKVTADRLAEESGVEVLLHSLVTDVVMEGNAVQGVIIEGKSGRQALLADQVVDCSGDADAAARAGVPFSQRSREELMGVTVMFHCSGVDGDRFLRHVREEQRPTYGDWGRNWTMVTSGREDAMFSPYLEDVFRRAQEEGIIPGDQPAMAGTWSTFTEAGEASGLNVLYSFGYDCTDVEDLTRAEQEGRRQALWALEAFRRFLPGFEKARLRNFGMTLGTRESRRIEGVKRVRKEDVLNQGRFEDSIGIFPEFIDGSGYRILPLTGRYYQIPYGCLVPREKENLLVAGRAVSADVTAFMSLRSMVCCTVTGQAAGTAAALAALRGEAPRKLSVNVVQEALKKQGVRIN